MYDAPRAASVAAIGGGVAASRHAHAASVGEGGLGCRGGALAAQLHARHPEYDWAANKGYGSKAHRAAITKHGWVAGLHRESFDPVKSMINDE